MENVTFLRQNQPVIQLTFTRLCEAPFRTFPSEEHQLRGEGLVNYLHVACINDINNIFELDFAFSCRISMKSITLNSSVLR